MIINVHVESEYINELKSALEYIKRKKLNIIYIWSHAGSIAYEDLYKIDRLMDQYPNLYVDLSTLEPYTKPTMPDLWPVDAEKLGRSWVLKNIKPNWKVLLLKFLDRFLIGLDLAFEERIDDLPNVISFYNHLLNQLDNRESADKIANKNAKKILGIK